MPAWPLLAVIAVAANGMADCACDTHVDQLPPTVRKALDALRNSAVTKAGGGGQQEYTNDEDEAILVQHVRDGIALRKIELPGRPGQPQAAKNRWQVLKTLGKYVLDHMRHVENANANLDSNGSASTLNKDLLAALMALRESELQRGSTTRWTLAQDIQLLEQ